MLRIPVTGCRELQEFLYSQARESLVTLNRPREGLQVQLRIVRYHIKGKPYFLLTSLLDSKAFPRHALQKLYHARWGIEEFFKTMKSVSQIEEFHSHSLDGIRQELFTFFFMQVVTRLLEKPNRKKTGSTKKKRASLQRQQISTKHVFYTLVALAPRLFRKNVSCEDLLQLQHFIQLGAYTAYGGRAFPRISHKPPTKWRPPKKKKKKGSKP